VPVIQEQAPLRVFPLFALPRSLRLGHGTALDPERNTAAAAGTRTRPVESAPPWSSARRSATPSPGRACPLFASARRPSIRRRHRQSRGSRTPHKCSIRVSRRREAAGPASRAPSRGSPGTRRLPAGDAPNRFRRAFSFSSSPGSF
jgi:hypothetical protein